MFSIYLIKKDTVPETVRVPLLLKEGCFKSNLTKIRLVELKMWIIQHFSKGFFMNHVIDFWSFFEFENFLNYPYLEFYTSDLRHFTFLLT